MLVVFLEAHFDAESHSRPEWGDWPVRPYELRRFDGSNKLQLWTCTDGFQRANVANVSVVWSSKAKVLNESCKFSDAMSGGNYQIHILIPVL